MSKSIIIAALSHDLMSKRSLVTLIWDGESEKAVSLQVPFGCGLDLIQEEAVKALRGLSSEIATIAVNPLG